ncbi:uncharacterized protein PADG_07062 [Paracoccidioides brasiliensis Pb18]|uniref:Uncharacterized protein n=1 Tax=Paracoccidioides brasiliensis (strain Pb18) TaxID=502780 RepID=C1GIH6_PARBD|nr:uncharacterized protein PADG_07062 [Paracoccidioides brasiliensis Pb18]EEH42242.2 hypothetical protein PADG_07062 [Paracoccidioides brasiliensis Pb18]
MDTSDEQAKVQRDRGLQNWIAVKQRGPGQIRFPGPEEEEEEELMDSAGQVSQLKEESREVAAAKNIRGK